MNKPASGKGFALLFEMGCGKTLTAIAIAGAAYKMGAIKRVLVIAPTSVVSVWPKEFENFADFKYYCRPLLGDKRRRLKDLEYLEKYPFACLKVAAINYEATWRDGIYEALEAYNADLIICDESQRIKTHNATQSKAVQRLGDRAPYKLILSGTPIQNNAVDIYSQYRFLDPSVFGTNFYKFRARYCIMGGFDNKQIIAYKDTDDLIRRVYSIAFRVTKEEALDLPEQTFETRTVTFSKKDRALYEQIKKDSYAQLESGGEITAPTVLTKLLRLQQLTGGFLVPDEDPEARPQQVNTAKLDALADLVTDYVVEARKKLVIFARFLPEVHAIEGLCKKLLPDPLSAVSIYGAIKKEDRGPIIQKFQTDPNTMVIIGQIDTLGTGVTLTAASTCVYYSKTFNYATYEQSLSRIHRIGQKNTCTYIDLVVEKSIDERITQALSRKEDMAGKIVDSWREFFT